MGTSNRKCVYLMSEVCIFRNITICYSHCHDVDLPITRGVESEPKQFWMAGAKIL